MANASFWERNEAASNWIINDGDSAAGRAKRTIGRLMAEARAAAERWAAILPDNPRNPGWYYLRKPLTYRMNKLEIIWLTELLNCANVCQDHDAQWFAQLLLGGPPEGIADFRLEVLFLLRAPDGNVERLVRLRNIRGEVSCGSHINGSTALDPVSLSAPEKFRAWCLARGNFNWSGNQNQLQMFHRDIGAENVGRLVNRVDSCGWYFLKEGLPGEKGFRGKIGLWFFGDVGIAPDGRKVRPDANGVIWIEGEGYLLNHKGRESEFTHGKPQMKPELTILNCGIDYTDWINQPKGETEEDHLRALFRELCHRAYENVGGYAAWLSLGMFHAFGAAAEIFDIYKIFPGLFLHGESQSGKNKMQEWLMCLWGYHIDVGLSFPSATAVGLQNEAENYSNLPVAVDEFGKGEIEAHKLAVLHNAANRQMVAKWNPDGGVQRKFKTVYVVSGERTCDDPAFRSRYLHIQLSIHRRLADHLAWFEANKRFFFLLGRYILEHREAFVQHTLSFLEGWLKNPAIKSNREKLVHGIAYSSWMAMCALLQSHDANETSAFKEFMVLHLREAFQDTSAEFNVNVFMDDFIACWKTGAIPKSSLKLKKLQSLEHPPGMPEMGPWNSYVLYLEPNAIIGAMQGHLAKQNRRLTLRRTDIRDQMKVHPYFQWKSSENKYLQIRFGTGKDCSNTRAWGILLDSHPYGLQHDATREDYDKFVLDDSLGDPRKGPLFTIVHALLQETESNQ